MTDEATSRWRRPGVKEATIIGAAVLLAMVIMWVPIAGLGEAGKISLVLFVMAALFWMTEVVPLFVTSLIILAVEIIALVPALQAEGIDASAALFMGPFFSDIILLFLGGLLLAQAGSKYRLDTWFAGQILRLVGRRPDFVLLGVMFAGAFLSMWMSNTATTAMMLIIAVAMTRDMPGGATGFKKALFLGIPFSCNLGGMGTPIGTPPNAISLVFLKKKGLSLGFLDWMVAALPLVIIMLFVLWVLLRVQFKLPKVDIPQQARRSFPDNWKARVLGVLFLLTVALWLSGSVHGLSSGTVALLAAIALLSSKILDGKDFRSISWDVLYLVGGGISLGLAIQRSGLADWITETLALGELGFVLAVLIFILLANVLTTFMSNTATANMLMPLAASLTLPHAPVIMAIALSASASMALPVSTPPNAIAYYSGNVALKDMFRLGLMVSLIAAGGVALFAFTYWRWIGIY